MFLSISLPLSRNLTPSLSYHIVRKRIAKVTDFLSLFPFGISIFPFLTIGISMYQKPILPYFIIPYFLIPSFFPFGELQTEGRTTFFTPFFFFSPEPGALPAGAPLLGWPNYGVDGRLNEFNANYETGPNRHAVTLHTCIVV